MACLVVKSVDLHHVRAAKHALNTKLARNPDQLLHWNSGALKSHDARICALEILAACPVRIFYVTFVKADLQAASGLSDRERLYNYTARLVIERASWEARQRGLVGQIHFAHLKGFPIRKLTDYVDYLRNRPTNIEWDSLTNKIHVDDTKQRDGLQFADIAAGALDRAIRPHQNPPHRIEPSYLKQLHPVLIKRQPPETYCFKSVSKDFYPNQPWWDDVTTLIQNDQRPG